MADDAPCALLCLIQGESVLFRVEPKRSVDIIELQKMIKEENSNRLQSVDASALTLWKVDLVPPPRNERKNLTGEDVPGSVFLEREFDKISDHWLAPPNPTHLHVIVELPPKPPSGEVGRPKKRARDGSTSDDDRWRQKWCQLDDDDEWKLFGDYWRKQNAQTTSDSLSVTLAYEERGEENPVYRLPLAPQAKNKIIVRVCYKLFYNFILDMRENKYNGLVLTGQPGTGKTLWLSYVLVRLLTENKPVVYHGHHGTFLFFGNSVYSYIPGEKGTEYFPPGKSAIFCLIDMDRVEEHGYSINFMTDITAIDKTFPVMASSPMPSRYKTWVKQRGLVPTQFMPLWGRDELKKGLEMQSFYVDLRRDIKTVLCSPSVDDSSTIAVSPVNLIHKEWRSLILSAVEMIRDGDGSMDDATEDDAMDDATEDDAVDDATEDDAVDDATEDDAMDDETGVDATDDATGSGATNNVAVEVDDVVDKILDNTIEAYGSSPRDVYTSIQAPVLAQVRITTAMTSETYIGLRDAVLRLERSEAGNTFSHSIFSMHITEPLKSAHLRTSIGFEVQFKSHWIKAMVLKHLEFLQHLDTAVMIKEMKAVTHSASLAGFLYEGFAAKELAVGLPPRDLVSMKANVRTTTFFVPNRGRTTKSPFNRPRERSYPSFSTGPAALEFDVGPGKSLDDYFWIPMAPNNPPFDAFVIEFNQNVAVVWIIQMTLSETHGGSEQGYQMIRLIKTKVQEAMETIHTKQQKRRKANNVKLNYVLVSPDPGQWKLPKKNWQSYKGGVYYQCVDHRHLLHS